MSGVLSLLANLQSLFLSSNMISSIDKETFRNMRSLEYLDLSNNNIKSINRNVFSNIHNLKGLKLNNASLTSLDDIYFQILTRIEIIDLGNNNLSNHLLALYTLRNLRELKLKKTNLKNLSIINFNLLRSLNDLDLSNNDLDYQTLSPTRGLNLLTNLMVLSLENTALKDISLLGPRYLRRLLTLNLRHNELTEIPGLIFRSISSVCQLRYLDLSYNRIFNFQRDGFGCLSSMRRLLLNNNYLNESESNLVFGHMRNLEELDVSNNGLNDFPEFNQMNTIDYFDYDLSRLIMNSNNLNHLRRSNFNKLRNLMILELNNNKISSIEDESFSYLHKLELLDLTQNLISTINQYTFKNLFNLKRLLLGNNRLIRLDMFSFDNLEKLEYLDLNDNYIYQIGSHAFSSLASLENICLKTLSYNNNSLVMDSDSFSGLKSIKTIYLASFKIVKNNKRVIVNTFRPKTLQKRVNNADYFRSIDIIIDDAKDSTYDCELVIEFIKNNIHLNLRDDHHISIFFHNCNNIDFKRIINRNNTENLKEVIFV